MTLLKQNYTLAYDEFKAAPWMAKVKTKIETLIKELTDSLNEEAENCHDAELLNPDVMYKRFKDNCHLGQFCGNWTILKYFTRMLDIKVYNEMIGNWLYTEEDKEMFDYFFNLKVTKEIKATPKILKFNNAPVNVYNYLDSTGNTVYIEFNSKANYNVYAEPYTNLFNGKFSCIDTLLRKSKMIMLYKPTDKLFEKECYTDIAIESKLNELGDCTIDDIKSKSYNEILSNERREYVEKYESTINKTQFLNSLNAFLNNNKIYIVLQALYTKKYNTLLAKFKNTPEGKELYDRLSDIEKSCF